MSWQLWTLTSTALKDSDSGPGPVTG